MSILKKLGLGQKKLDKAPGFGTGRLKEQQEFNKRKAQYFRVVIIIVFLGLVLAALPQTTFQPVASYSIGEPWRADDLTAPFTFSIQKTADEIQEEREEIRRQTAPIYHIDSRADVFIEARLDSVYRSIQPVLDSYVQWQRALEQDEATAESDSLRFEEEKSFVDVEFGSAAWEILLENYRQTRMDNLPENRSLIFQVRNRLDTIISNLLSDGVIDQSKEDIEHDEITIRDLRRLTERTISLNNVYDPDEASDFVRLQLNRHFRPAVAQAAHQLFNRVMLPNYIYSESDTEALLEQNLANISTTKGAVDQGEIIIRRGDIVTPDTANKLRSLAEARALTATELERWLRYFGEALVIIIATLMFFFYLYLYRKVIFDRPLMFLLVFLVLGIVTLASALIYPLEDVNSYIVPIAIAPIILTIIFDSRVGLMATVTLAIITGLIHDYHFEYTVATIAACSFGVYSVRDIKKRSQFFFITPGVVFVTYLLVVSGFALARFSGWEGFFEDMFFIAINSVFILFTYPLILLFEKVFKITTDFTLLELADTNLPVMKELMSKAPGTFHHSLQVANLSESAASDIGANALLCRVGAMYHDIGKMVKPTYFIENQNKSNEHDKLKPRMSALVIKAHVSEGVKIAREHNLPEVIIDFIKTHHGTSLIRYFHKKALDNADDFQEEDFRYDGPIPFTKEQGILMLADSIEAACRSMKDTTYNKLENMVNRIVESNVNDGQLSNCPLTFQQIQIIKDSFLGILKGVYHSRIEYPDEEKQDQTKPETDVSEAEEQDEELEKG